MLKSLNVVAKRKKVLFIIYIRVMAGRAIMATVVAETAHTSRSWYRTAVGIWKNIGGSLASSVLQFRSYSDEGLAARVLSGPEASTAAPRSAVPKTRAFLAYRRVDDENAYPVRKCEEHKVKIPSGVPEFRRTWVAARSRVRNHKRAFRNVAQESSCDSPSQGFVCGTEPPLGSACGPGNLHLPSPTATGRAIAVLKNRQQQGINSDSYAFVEVLKRCSEQKDITAARQIHDCIIQSGMDKDPSVINTLLNVYFKCGRLEDACQVFDGLERKTVVTWNVMIGGYAKNGCGVEAYQRFLHMKLEGVKPNAITYLSILNASASAGALEWVKEVHGHVRRAGLESDLRVGSALVRMYAKSGSIGDARVVFDRLKTRDVTSWTIMIGAYAESGCRVEAYRLFLQMEREGFKPNAYTYASILNASASAGALEWVREVHRHALEARLESDIRVGGALVHMYAKNGYIDDARLVFNKMEDRDVVAWNIMIGGLAQHGCGHEALELFRQMNADGVNPDETTFTAVLSACCHAGLVDDGRKLFLAMTQDYDIEPDVVHHNCIVDLLGRVGHLEEAKLLIDNMPVEPDAETWKALLGACRTYGNVELGELAANEVLKLEPKDAAAYVLLSNIYAAAGKWEKVSSVRTMMQKRGVRKEPGRSWIEVDNKIHEFVVGDTSHPEAKAIYTELKKLTEQLKAKGYIPDTKLVLHNMDEEEKKLALCYHSEKLAIAYGLLRVPNGKSICVKKNLRFCSDCHAATKLISEVTGREIIVRDANRFHHFKGGVCSCGDYW